MPSLHLQLWNGKHFVCLTADQEEASYEKSMSIRSVKLTDEEATRPLDELKKKHFADVFKDDPPPRP